MTKHIITARIAAPDQDNGSAMTEAQYADALADTLRRSDGDVDFTVDSVIDGDPLADAGLALTGRQPRDILRAFTKPELNTILAALRTFQHGTEHLPIDLAQAIDTIETDDGATEELSVDQVDALCEFINMGAARPDHSGVVDWPIRAVLDLSTAHLTTDTRDLLDRWGVISATDGAISPIVASTGCGWFVHVNETRGADVPDDLWACIEAGRAMNCDYLLFDRDGDELAELAVYSD